MNKEDFTLSPVESNAGGPRMTRLTDMRLSPASPHPLQTATERWLATWDCLTEKARPYVTVWHEISPDSASCLQAGLTVPVVTPEVSV